MSGEQEGVSEGEREEAENESTTHVLHDGEQDSHVETEGINNLIPI